jgi:hypothetical protein
MRRNNLQGAVERRRAKFANAASDNRTPLQVAEQIWKEMLSEMFVRACDGVYGLRYECCVGNKNEDVVRAYVCGKLREEEICFRADVYQVDGAADYGILVVETCWQPGGFCLTCGEVHAVAKEGLRQPDEGAGKPASAQLS